MRHLRVMRREKLLFHRFVAARVFAQLRWNVLEIRQDGAQRAQKLRRLPAVLMGDQRQSAEYQRRFRRPHIVVRDDIAGQVGSHARDKGQRSITDTFSQRRAQRGMN